MLFLFLTTFDHKSVNNLFFRNIKINIEFIEYYLIIYLIYIKQLISFI